MKFNFNSKKDLFYFLHIPKTAGTSLVNILENQFSYDHIYHEVIWPELFKNLPLDFNSLELIRGHFGYWILDLLPKKPKILTMIRRPREQILSLYEHQKRAFDEDQFSMLKSKDEPIMEILKDPPRRRRLANHQTRNLTLEIDSKKINQVLKQHQKIEQSELKPLQAKLPNLPGNDLLELAKKRLNSFEFIGITEKFEKSLQLLYYTFGWYPIKFVPKENVGERKTTFESLDDEIKNELRKAIKLDNELYKYANEIFDSRFSSMLDYLNKKYYEPKYEKLNSKEVIYKMLEKNYLTINKFPNSLYGGNLQFDVKDETICYGWHQREYWPDKNKVIRWSGPTNDSVLYLPLKSEKKIQFEIFILASTFDLNKLKIKVNDNLIPFEISVKLQDNLINKFKGRKSGGVIKGIIPSSVLNTEHSLTKFSIINNKTSSFKDLNRFSNDFRMLGFAIEKIIFKEIN